MDGQSGKKHHWIMIRSTLSTSPRRLVWCSASLQSKPLSEKDLVYQGLPNSHHLLELVAMCRQLRISLVIEV
jgi:hypothetical protein